MASQLLSLAGWWFLPNLATSYIQPTLYTIITRAGDPKPAPGSPRFIRDRKRIHTAVILFYLAYTIFEAHHELIRAGNFYQALNVPIDVSEKGLRSRWRRINAGIHPDKAPSPEEAQALAYLRPLYDTLKTPAQRFAYDRFGPEILTWQSCTTTRDFIYQALTQASAYYIGSGIVLLVISRLGYLRAGVFWRFLIMAGLFWLEVMFATRSHFLGVLITLNWVAKWMPGVSREYLPFQLVVLLRKVAITVFVAINQLGPLFAAPEDAAAEQGEKALTQWLDRADAIANAVDGEMLKLLKVELTPFTGSPSDIEQVKGGLRGFLEANTIRSDREVQEAMMEVIKRRQGGAGAVES